MHLHFNPGKRPRKPARRILKFDFYALVRRDNEILRKGNLRGGVVDDVIVRLASNKALPIHEDGFGTGHDEYKSLARRPFKPIGALYAVERFYLLRPEQPPGHGPRRLDPPPDPAPVGQRGHHGGSLQPSGKRAEFAGSEPQIEVAQFRPCMGHIQADKHAVEFFDTLCGALRKDRRILVGKHSLHMNLIGQRTGKLHAKP